MSLADTRSGASNTKSSAVRYASVLCTVPCRDLAAEEYLAYRNNDDGHPVTVNIKRDEKGLDDILEKRNLGAIKIAGNHLVDLRCDEDTQRDEGEKLALGLHAGKKMHHL